MALQNEQFVGTKDAMIVLGIKSQATIGKYEPEGKIKAYRTFSNLEIHDQYLF